MAELAPSSCNSEVLALTSTNNGSYRSELNSSKVGAFAMSSRDDQDHACWIMQVTKDVDEIPVVAQGLIGMASLHIRDTSRGPLPPCDW